MKYKLLAITRNCKTTVDDIPENFFIDFHHVGILSY